MSDPQQAFTQVILDSLGEGLFTVGKDFKINSLNRAAEKIIGRSRQEVIGDYCKNIFKTRRCYDDCPIGRILETGEEIFDLESDVMGPDGKKIPIKLNAAILKDEHKNPIGGVVSFRDLSYLEELNQTISRHTGFEGIIAQDKTITDIFDLIEEIADSNSNVLILGESGTGKELIADAIQKTSSRADNSYIKVNCSVLPPHLLASELFGHIKGAFTDAVRDRVGRFEMADKGTLFLDEIAEMPLQMQVQLLRVLQKGTFERVGESVTRKVDVRVIAATNRDIEEELSKKRFREDLYYRLNVIPITIPPLRERVSDIPHLVQHFLNKYSLISGKKIREIDDEAMDMLLCYDWPGNVRELENTIEYAFARTKGTVLHASKIPPRVRLGGNCGPQAARNIPKYAHTDNDSLKIRTLLEKHHWNRSIVAKEMGIGRTTLWRKMRALGLDR